MTKKHTPRTSGPDFYVKNRFKLKTKNHQDFLTLLESESTNMVFGSGPAGTGKTYLAVMAGLKALKNKECDNLVYIRSVVESADRNIGSLPGEIDEKFSPWTIPLMEKMQELISDKIAINKLFTQKKIQCMPVNFARGRTFSDSFVILDEAQNCSTQELKTILTRFGEGSKYVVLGDPDQSDINGKSGYYATKEKFSNKESEKNGIYVINFEKDDIVRSGILKFIVEMLETKVTSTWTVGGERR